MRMIKKLLVPIVAGALLATSVLGVAAASRRDVFNAQYYADTYADLKAAFGYNEEALYKHYVTYGTVEGRNVSPVLDIVKYRQTYKDLDKAFGDNWDAYVDHYFTYGIKEKRVSGGTFDPVAYAEAYPDIKAAFGNDYKAIINHYLTFGIKEGRTAGVKIQTAPAAAGGGGGGSDDDGDDGGSSGSGGSGGAVDVTDTIRDLPSTVTDGNVEAVVEKLTKSLTPAEQVAVLLDSIGRDKVATAESAYAEKNGIRGTVIQEKDASVLADNLPGVTSGDIVVVGAALNLTVSGSNATVEFTKPSTTESETVTASLVSGDNLKVVNIRLMADNKPLDPKFPVSITMPVPTGVSTTGLRVWHYKDGVKNDPVKISPVLNNDGTMTFVVNSFSTFVIGNEVSVAGNVVKTESDLVNAVKAGSKFANITLGNNISLTSKLAICGSRTIDFGGYTVTAGSDTAGGIELADGANVTLVNGTLASATDSQHVVVVGHTTKDKGTSLTLGEQFTVSATGTEAQALRVNDGSVLVIEETAKVSAAKGYGVNVRGGAGATSGTANAYAYRASEVTVKGTVEGWIYGMTVQGNRVSDNDATIVNIASSAKINVIAPGVHSADGAPHDGSVGLYLAGNSKTTVDGGEISGSTGIEIRAGELTINGGTIYGTNNHVGSKQIVANGNGATVCGAGLAVSQHNTLQPITVTINGGVFGITDRMNTYGLVITDIEKGNEGGVTGLVKVEIPEGSTAVFKGSVKAIKNDIKSGTLKVNETVTDGDAWMFNDSRTNKGQDTPDGTNTVSTGDTIDSKS